MRNHKRAIALGAVAGVVFTRLPYMEDGNLLTTTVCVVTFAAMAVAISTAYKKFFQRLRRS